MPADFFADLPYPSEFTFEQDISLLTDDERRVIADYTAGRYLAINRTLRGLRTSTPQVDADTAILRGALRKFPLEHGCRATRETESTDLGISAEDTPELLIEEQLTELGFLSASGLRVPPRIADRRRPVWLDLALPAGTPALLLTEDLTRAGVSEREVLVVDARRMLVLGVSWQHEEELWIVHAVVEQEQ